MTEVTALNISDLHDLSKNENFFTISFKMQTYIQMSSINYVLLFIKLLKYLSSWFPRARIIFKTLSAAQTDIISFLIMYIIIFLAFVVMSHIYYGAD
jgi:Polycystin cation channel